MNTQRTSHADPQSFPASWRERPTEIDLAMKRLAAMRTHSDSALAQLIELKDELMHELGSGGSVGAVERFLVRGDAGERLVRTVAVRTLQKLTFPKMPPAPAVACGSRSRSTRPLTGLELGAVRLSALDSPRRVAVVALLEAGVHSSELAFVVASDLRDDGSVVSVERRTLRDCADSVAVIAPWAHGGVRKLRRASLDDDRLLYEGKASDDAAIQSAILMRVRATICDAGLGGDKAVRPLSLALPETLTDSAGAA